MPPQSHATPSALRWPNAAAGIVVLLMLGCGLNIALNDGFGHGAGLDTFNAGAADPWQLFINMDLISGLLLMLAWVLWRERGGPLLERIAWTLLILWWGNIVVACYILYAAWQADGKVAAFFMGRHAPGSRLRSVRALGPLPRWLAGAGALAAALLMLDGLRTVGLGGAPAVGYIAAFGTITFALAVLALSARTRIN